MKHKRYLRNLIISKDTQLRFGIAFVVATMILNAVLLILGIAVYRAWLADPSLPPMMLYSLVGAVYLVTYGCSFTVAMFVSHRVLGPVVAIEHFVNRIKLGDYSARLRLRTTDDRRIRALGDSLNDLAEKLEHEGPYANGAPRRPHEHG